MLRRSNAVTYSFITRHKHANPISLLCQVVGVSRNGYDQYRKNHEGQPKDPDQQEMIEWVQDLAKSSGDTYGSRRMKKALKVLGDPVSREKALRRLLKAHGLEGSMSRKGNCWDHAVVESCFGTLKQERVPWRHYQSRHEAQQDLLDDLSMFYNRRRLHSHLGYMSPNDFERQLIETKKAA